MKRIVVVIAVVALAGSCGILNSIFGNLDVTQQQLTDACNQVQAKCGVEAKGEGEGEGEGEGASTDFDCTQFGSCLAGKAGHNGCVDAYNAAVECVLQGSNVQCNGGPCKQQLDAWASCELNGGGDKPATTGGTGATTTTDPLQQVCIGGSNGGQVCGGANPVSCNGSCCSTAGCGPGGVGCAQAGPTCDPSNCSAPNECVNDTQGGSVCLQSLCVSPPCNCTDNTCCQACLASCPGPCNGQATGTCETGDASCCAACTACPVSGGTSCGDPHFVGCPACAGQTGNCGDGICAQSEKGGATPCALDCGGHSCAFDGICAAPDDLDCGDCSTACANDADCTGANKHACADVNGLFCQSGTLNCNNNEPKVHVCHATCNRSSDCNTADDPFRTMCTVDPINARKICDAPFCHNDADCGAAGDVCASNVDLVDDPATGTPSGGFCLPTCDPVACAGTGGAGTCTCPAQASHCTTVRDSGQNPAAFACTFALPGASPEGGVCQLDTDCNNGLGCFGGSCRFFCGNIGSACNPPAPGGRTCSALPTVGGVGICQ